MSSNFTEILQRHRVVKTIISRLDFLLPEDEDSNLFSLLVQGASGSFVLKIISTGLGLLTSLILARILGVDQYGTYAYVMSWVLLLGIPAGLGLDKVIIRFVATYNRQGEWAKIKGLIRYSNIAIIIVSLILILAVYLTLQIVIHDKNKSSIYTPLLIALILLPLNSLISRQGSVLRGFQWIISAQIPSMLIRPLMFIMLIGIMWLLYSNSLSVKQLISLNVLATIFALLVSIYFLLKVVPSSVKNSFPVNEFREWITSALPLMLMGGMNMINGQADILMLGSIKGTQFSGIYQVVDRGAGLILFLLSAILAPFAPLIAHIYAGNEFERLQRIVRRVSRLTFFLSLPTALFLIIFGKWILGIFGSGFVEGYIALVILCISQLVNIASGPVVNLLVMTGHERYAAFGFGISTLINVLLNAFFIPFWNMEGAAVATGTSIIIWNIMLIYFAIKRVGINPTVF